MSNGADVDPITIKSGQVVPICIEASGQASLKVYQHKRLITPDEIRYFNMNSDSLLHSRSFTLNNPFVVHSLPLIVRLSQMGYHRFRRRWSKRFFKRPARALFDFAYHTLNLQGQGTMTLTLPDGARPFTFNGRNLQFSGVYAYDQDFVFEAPLVAIMEKVLRDREVLFDVGANWGCISLYAAAFAGYRGEIHAFEPMPGTYSDLQSVVDQTSLGDRIHCHKVGLSDQTDTAIMVLPDRVQSGWARIVPGGAGNGVDVAVARLDDMGLPSPTFMKIDVEGHELAMLQGAEKTLTDAKPYIVFENWLNRQDVAETMGPWCFLENLGYVFYCPAWYRETPHGPEISLTNMPPTGARQCLLPYLKEHRFLGPEHWSFLAVHRDRLADLIKKFDQN